MADFYLQDSTELHLLVRALIEAKLPGFPRDEDLSASPLVARLAERAAQAHTEDSAMPAALKNDWRSFGPKHSYWGAAVSRALLDSDWLRKSTRAQREEYIRLLIVPFQATETVFAALVELIENILDTHRSYELWLCAERPYEGGTLIVREREDGTMLVHDHARSEVFSTTNRFQLWEWLNERGFRQVGCYVEAETEDQRPA